MTKSETWFYDKTGLRPVPVPLIVLYGSILFKF